MAITPEDRARDNIEKLLIDAGWIVQGKRSTHLSAGRGEAVREFPLKSGHGVAGYLLFVDGAADRSCRGEETGRHADGRRVANHEISRRRPRCGSERDS